MRIVTVADEGALARAAADLVCAAVDAKPDAVLGLPTGTTPIGMYRELERRSAAGEADFSGTVVYAIDEFAGVAPATPGTNRMFYRAHLRLPVHALHVPDAGAPESEAHIAAFADAVRRAGGFDVCVLGVGANGHIAFNEPGSARDSRARVVELAKTSRQAHAAAFGGIERVPRQGMTLGIADLLEARTVLVLATGAAKAEIVRRAVDGPMTAAVPASWLQAHGDCTWLLDAAAARTLRAG
ncbi:MAG: glucosamine-6-phosphate deaminase [Chloroflexota bacterium]|nr:glucosamine-6-phosphate deaminase [Chloroflexota bacterium]